MQDPYLTLGVDRDATDETIRQAYLEGIRRSPPDQDPQCFQSIQAAYEILRTRKLRLEYALFHNEPPTPIELLERLSSAVEPGRPDSGLFRDLLRSGSRQEKK